MTERRLWRGFCDPNKTQGARGPLHVTEATLLLCPLPSILDRMCSGISLHRRRLDSAAATSTVLDGPRSTSMVCGLHPRSWTVHGLPGSTSTVMGRPRFTSTVLESPRSTSTSTVLDGPRSMSTVHVHAPGPSTVLHGLRPRSQTVQGLCPLS